MYSHLGSRIADLREYLLHGLRGAWIDESTRRAWSVEWAAQFDSLAYNLSG
jgi:adenosine deaminase